MEAYQIMRLGGDRNPGQNLVLRLEADYVFGRCLDLTYQVCPLEAMELEADIHSEIKHHENIPLILAVIWKINLMNVHHLVNGILSPLPAIIANKRETDFWINMQIEVILYRFQL